MDSQSEVTWSEEVSKVEFWFFILISAQGGAPPLVSSRFSLKSAISRIGFCNAGTPVLGQGGKN
jgi:hypothetical protein